MSEARTRSARLGAVAIVAVIASLLVPAFSSPANAALPTKNTTYKDSSVQGTSDGSKIKIKVGSDTHKISKLTIIADCGSSKDRFTRRNITIKDNGSFSIAAGLFVNITGQFKSKHKATGNITTDQCGFFGGEFVAKD